MPWELQEHWAVHRAKTAGRHCPVHMQTLCNFPTAEPSVSGGLPFCRGAACGRLTWQCFRICRLRLRLRPARLRAWRSRGSGRRRVNRPGEHGHGVGAELETHRPISVSARSPLS